MKTFSHMSIRFHLLDEDSQASSFHSFVQLPSNVEATDMRKSSLKSTWMLLSAHLFSAQNASLQVCLHMRLSWGLGQQALVKALPSCARCREICQLRLRSKFAYSIVWWPCSSINGLACHLWSLCSWHFVVFAFVATPGVFVACWMAVSTWLEQCWLSSVVLKACVLHPWNLSMLPNHVFKDQRCILFGWTCQGTNMDPLLFAVMCVL